MGHQGLLSPHLRNPRNLRLNPVPTFRKCVILLHRYLGIALCLLFVMWFVSGIAMIFARGMPRLTPEMRLDRLPGLDFAAIKIPPSVAAQKAQLDRAPARASL